MVARSFRVAVVGVRISAIRPEKVTGRPEFPALRDLAERDESLSVTLHVGDAGGSASRPDSKARRV